MLVIERQISLPAGHACVHESQCTGVGLRAASAEWPDQSSEPLIFI